MDDNWWIDVAVEHWGQRWLPWAQLVGGVWQPHVLGSKDSYPKAIMRSTVRALGRCVDDYRAGVFVGDERMTDFVEKRLAQTADGYSEEIANA